MGRPSVDVDAELYRDLSPEGDLEARRTGDDFHPMLRACRASPLLDPWAQNDPLVEAGFESAPSSKWNQGDSLEGVPFRRKAARKPLMEESPAHRR